jgi:hypothetical protein
MTNSEIILRALAPLQGQTFKGRVDFEDALYPHYGPLQAIFPGKTHRDLADQLLTARWASKDQETYSINLPMVNVKLTTDAAEDFNEVGTELSYEELQLLIELSRPAGGMAVQKFLINDRGIDGLLAKKLVHSTEDNAPAEHKLSRENEDSAARRAIVAIQQKDYYSGMESLSTAIKEMELQSNQTFFYVLTKKGEAVVAKVKTAKVTI